ncbi:hypothetical protein GGR50DRAFT_3941 [Xylaria sp. CBS 124048]|nr:hypothetical protein GGR50DRAFT_3941 [Xylaria sp. CBS 124048]
MSMPYSLSLSLSLSLPAEFIPLSHCKFPGPLIIIKERQTNKASKQASKHIYHSLLLAFSFSLFPLPLPRSGLYYTSMFPSHSFQSFILFIHSFILMATT